MFNPINKVCAIWLNVKGVNHLAQKYRTLIKSRATALKLISLDKAKLSLHPMPDFTSERRDMHTFTEFEAVLGPSERRYFGQGYRLTEYKLSELICTDDRVVGRARVTYPLNWSQKNGQDPRNSHLSTIDATILAQRMTEFYLLSKPRLALPQISTASIERMVISAGAKPLEEIDTVPLSTVRTDTTDHSDAWSTTSLTHKIGSMTVQTLVRHRTPPTAPAPLDTTHLEESLNEPERDLFRNTVHNGTVQENQNTTDSITCELLTTPTPGHAVGLESSYWPQATLVDRLVLAGQMAQVLIYRRLQTDRDATDTLWMRKVEISLDRQHALPLSATSTMAVEQDQQLKVGEATYRSIKVCAQNTLGATVKASLALKTA